MNNINEEHNTEHDVDEDAGILIEEFLRITDPETGTVLYEGRA